MIPSSKEIQFLLSDVSNPASYSKLMQLVYGELRKMAAHFFKAERPDHTLQPTALVHELYLRLLGSGPGRYENRAHFFGVAARAMRQILVEHARSRESRKRGGDRQRVPLENLEVPGEQAPDYFDLDRVLDRLERMDERCARIVELRVFGGLSSQEIAELLDMGESTVRREWDIAKAWLEKELGPVQP